MTTPEPIRPPAVAGTFYPASRSELGRVVSGLLAGRPASARPLPRAIVVPHAGFVYSGAIAASAYALLAPHAERIGRIVLIGPAHRVRVDGLVSPGAERLRTPLGDVRVDAEALAAVPSVREMPLAHAREHCLEVELPFLQHVAPRARVAPLVVGRAGAAEVAAVLDAIVACPVRPPQGSSASETVIVCSSDLSHYLPYDEGRERDQRTAERIVALDSALDGEDACGAAALNGLARHARAHGLRAELVDLRSSGDTAGSRDEVVGYGAFAFYGGAS